jgi:hypothetical protein
VCHIDDRAAIVKTEAKAKLFIDKWASWAKTLGFQENRDKMQIMRLTGKPFQSDTLNAHMVDNMRVLGADFTTKAARHKLGTTAKQRVEDALARARRIKCLGLLGCTRVVSALRCLVMSKATWAWWRCDPPQQLLNKFSRAVRDTLGANLRTGNFLLHRLLRGHWLDLGFMAGAMTVGYFWAAVSSSGVAAARASARSSLGWAGRVRRWHTAHGGTFRENGDWAHGSLTWNVQGYTQQKARLLHEYREAWRKRVWDDYNAKHGQNGKSIGVYCPKYYAALRNFYDDTNSGAKRVMEGSTISDARTARWNRQRELPSSCPRCGASCVPHWLHLAWECAALETGRPAITWPELVTAAVWRSMRLGWPRPSAAAARALDTDVVKHLAEVRCTVLHDYFKGA